MRVSFAKLIIGFFCFNSLVSALFVFPKHFAVDGDFKLSSFEEFLTGAILALISIPLAIFEFIVAGKDIFINGNILGFGTSQALITFVFAVFYFTLASFVVESRNGIPLAYRFFRFFITQSGASQISGSGFSAKDFDSKVSGRRRDYYQSAMEVEELKKATKKARAKAEWYSKRNQKQSEIETTRMKAAEEAAKAAEEKLYEKFKQAEWRKARKRK